MCVRRVGGLKKEKGGSGSYLDGLVEQGALQKLILVCLLTPAVSTMHFILLSFSSSAFSAGAKMPQK